MTPTQQAISRIRGEKGREHERKGSVSVCCTLRHLPSSAVSLTFVHKILRSDAEQPPVAHRHSEESTDSLPYVWLLSRLHSKSISENWYVLIWGIYLFIYLCIFRSNRICVIYFIFFVRLSKKREIWDKNVLSRVCYTLSCALLTHVLIFRNTFSAVSPVSGVSKWAVTLVTVIPSQLWRQTSEENRVKHFNLTSVSLSFFFFFFKFIEACLSLLGWIISVKSTISWMVVNEISFLIDVARSLSILASSASW